MKKKSTGSVSRLRQPTRRQKLVRIRSEDLSRLEDRTDWSRVDALTDQDIEQAIADDPDAAPILDQAFWRNATLLDPRHGKSTITMRIDEDVLDFFKRGGSGYQSRMNAVLRAYVYSRLERMK
jgi:uncharacterized protein (DUF4415 family)